MFFTFVLVSALTLSAVLGRSSGPKPMQMMYEKEDLTVMQTNETAQMMATDDRSSNLKYVMVIQGSSIWEEIKKRSLTISTQHRLDDTEKSPDNLTDQELAQLKRACHDGLKCVAVDQLLVLKQVKEPLGGGMVSVRRAITKITQVLTQYTTEYHEDVYQYEAVQQSDDQSKVYESVTTIVEDNKELCQIDLTPAAEESHPQNNGDGNPHSGIVKNNTVNYNTTNNYNINNGTVNSATIDIKPHSGDTVDGDRPDHGKPPVRINIRAATADSPMTIESKIRSPDQRDVNAEHKPETFATVDGAPAATDGPAGDRAVTGAPEIDGRHKRARQDSAQGTGTSDRRYEPVTVAGDHPEYARSADDHRKPIGQQLMITDEPSPRDGVVSDNGSARQKARRSRPDVSGRTDGANADEPAAANNKVVLNHSNRNGAPDRNVTKKTADGVNNNTVELDNSTGCNTGGENDSDSDIVSAGSHNIHSSRKGLVEDGLLNNGNMKVKNVDKSNRNKGTIKGAKANNGIINVGTTNNGPVNYGTYNGYTNNGTTSNIDSYDIRQYVDNINKIYSTMLNEFAKK